MNVVINPFQQLYFSDDIQTENNFVELFSEEVLQAAIYPIFQGGNVVLSGAQGCGKTMILHLLRPETRIAYNKHQREFPVPRHMRNFISAGMNLTRSGIIDIVQVTLNRGEEADLRELPLYFSDFFNYLIIKDLIKSIETIGNNREAFDSIVDLTNIHEFSRDLGGQKSWFGYLDNVSSLEDLKNKIDERINFYRNWINGNSNDLEPPTYIRHSKTNIGEPIARTAECLREHGIIADNIPVLIRIDQIEELHRAFTDRQRQLRLSFRKLINRVFASRDARVNYRAGTRRYGWNNSEFLGVWGSEALLENRRDYIFIDMDKELFIPGEAGKSIFKKFASDAFQRRVQYYFRNQDVQFSGDLAKTIFGNSPKAHERISQLRSEQNDKQIDRALGLDLAADGGNWSEEWRCFLRNLYRNGNEGKIDATLAAAWGRQTGGGQFKVQHRESPPPSNSPWRERQWWRKERLDQAVLQLMTRCQQRFMWWGYEDICSLSNGNITVFFHICHRIWDGFLKNESSLPESKRTDILNGGKIGCDIQDAGIVFASNEWFNKLPEEPGGNSRKNFVEKLGARLNKEMTGDLRMAYPGGNGVSFVISEFESDAEDITELRNFIREAVGYGALVTFDHSSKLKTGQRRVKFHLNSILCPRFQLPEARTKEPYYWKIQDLFELTESALVTLPRARKPTKAESIKQLSIPGFESTDI